MTSNLSVGGLRLSHDLLKEAIVPMDQSWSCTNIQIVPLKGGASCESV